MEKKSIFFILLFVNYWHFRYTSLFIVFFSDCLKIIIFILNFLQFGIGFPIFQILWLLLFLTFSCTLLIHIIQELLKEEWNGNKGFRAWQKWKLHLIDSLGWLRKIGWKLFSIRILQLFFTPLLSNIQCCYWILEMYFYYWILRNMYHSVCRFFIYSLFWLLTFFSVLHHFKIILSTPFWKWMEIYLSFSCFIVSKNTTGHLFLMAISTCPSLGRYHFFC